MHRQINAEKLMNGKWKWFRHISPLEKHRDSQAVLRCIQLALRRRKSFAAWNAGAAKSQHNVCFESFLNTYFSRSYLTERETVRRAKGNWPLNNLAKHLSVSVSYQQQMILRFKRSQLKQNDSNRAYISGMIYVADRGTSIPLCQYENIRLDQVEVRLRLIS